MADREKRYYIAYGSNLSVEQMRHRTPDARIVGTAVLDGWQLFFRQFATIRENPAYRTPVLVWDISERDEANLDRYEGFPSFYFKRELPVTVKPLTGGAPMSVTAMVYIMTEDCRRETVLPSRYYYDILRKGYETFGFDKRVLWRALADSSKEAGADLAFERGDVF